MGITIILNNTTTKNEISDTEIETESIDSSHKQTPVSTSQSPPAKIESTSQSNTNMIELSVESTDDVADLSDSSY